MQSGTNPRPDNTGFAHRPAGGYMLISQKLEVMTTDYKDARSVVGAFMLEQRTNLQNLSMQQVADAT